MPKVIERVMETIERLKTRPIILGEGKLLDTMLQRLDYRRPNLIQKALETVREWEPGRKIFGSKEKR